MGMLTVPIVMSGSMAGAEQPAIAGDGVRLRPWRAGDLDAVLAAFADPAVQQWHCRSMTGDEARDWIAGWAGRWRAESDASWAVTLGDRDEAAGQIGLRRVDLHDGLASVSYWTGPSARGRGVAPRALAALVGWSFGSLGLHRLALSHSTANPASCRVAEKAGFAAEGIKRAEGWHADGWHDMHLHALVAGDLP